jgi:hypothetical protein
MDEDMSDGVIQGEDVVIDGTQNDDSEDSMREFIADDEEEISENAPEVRFTAASVEEFRGWLPVLRARNSAIALWPSSIPNAGLGVFALRRFEKGEPITEYRGFAITAEEAAATPRNRRTHFRQLFLRKFVLDGLRLDDGTRITNPKTQMLGRGIGAFVNDARGPQNNAEFATFVTDKLARQLETEGVEVDKDPTQKTIYLIALRTIQPYEEVFCSYGAAYDWD